MVKNTSVALGEHFTAFIKAQLAQGRYGSASEVVRAGLRLLEEHENDRAALQKELDRGKASGVSTRRIRETIAGTRRKLDNGEL